MPPPQASWQLKGRQNTPTDTPVSHPTLSATLGMAHPSFDYVIIGGGTAGLALAVRLAEDKGVSVCVLEAGKDHTGTEDVKIPGGRISYCLPLVHCNFGKGNTWRTLGKNGMRESSMSLGKTTE